MKAKLKNNPAVAAADEGRRIDVVHGDFTKKDAARLIADGQLHLHSCGEKSDADCDATQRAVQARKLPTYAWESGKTTKYLVGSSQERTTVIREIAEKSKSAKRGAREQLHTVLEELLTNAVYHAYRATGGKEKYSRKDAVSLQPHETVEVFFRHDAGQIFLKVIDRGGSLRFTDIAEAFRRTYQPHPVIQNKESGAGLGIYMIFEAVKHLKVVTKQGTFTAISVVISEDGHAEPNEFSFNFFDGGAYAAE